MKYYIKAWFGEWQEVTKEKAEEFINNLFKSCTTKITLDEVKKNHLKIVIANL